jgi:hypothetical protein
MTEHPIIMSAESIRAIQAHIKTQTRRPIKPQPVLLPTTGVWAWDSRHTGIAAPPNLEWAWRQFLSTLARHCPYGQPGDRLRVKEGFYVQTDMGFKLSEPQPIEYAANVPDRRQVEDYRYVSAIFMPRWASRFILPLTIVRAERLWDITPKDARAEGVEALPGYADAPFTAYMAWWGRIYGKTYPMDLNPWVWVLGWEQVEAQ